MIKPRGGGRLLIALRRSGSIYFEAHDDPNELTAADEQDLALLEHEYRRVRASVQLNGIVYRTDVFAPNSGVGDCYILTDEHLVPLDNSEKQAAERIGNILDRFRKYLNALHGLLGNSDAITTTGSISLKTQFIEPRFSNLSASAEEQGAHPSGSSWGGVDRFLRAVILGAPGAGKTSALRRLAIEWSRGSRNPELLPIYVQLRNVEETLLTPFDVIALAKRALGDESNESFEQLAQNGQAILLLDGLDEVNQSHRSSLTESVSDICSQYPRMGVILTCRSSAYQGEFPDFERLSLLPFDDSQVAQWSWLAIEDEVECNRFLRCLSDEPTIRELVRTPLLLSLTVDLYRHHGILPRERASILETYVSAMIDGWDRARDVPRLVMPARPKHVFWLLCNLSFHILQEQRLEFREDEIQEWLSDGDWEENVNLHTIEDATGLLTRVHPGSFRFVHTAFIEYFCAEYIVRCASDPTELLRRRLSEPVWQDVWQLACDLTPDATSLVRSALQSDLGSPARLARLLLVALTHQTRVDKATVDESAMLIAQTLDDLLSNHAAKSPSYSRGNDLVLVLSEFNRESERQELDWLLRDLFAARRSRFTERLIYFLHNRSGHASEVAHLFTRGASYMGHEDSDESSLKAHFSTHVSR